MMRLASGHKGMGLQGIRRTAAIPECWGLHGVHQSRIHEIHSVRVQRVEMTKMEDSKPLVRIEDGGINIHRPLLGFSKSSLKATCLHYRIRWIEDATNSDPTATTRNAIRHLLHHRDLPLALRKTSLLSIADRMHKKAIDRWASADNFFRGCHILIFDARSGGLAVRLPDRVLQRQFQFIPLEYRERNIFLAQYKASLLLRRLIEIVTPQEVVALENLRFSVNAMFPELENPNAVEVDKGLAASNFTVAGVSFKRFHSPLRDPEGTDKLKNRQEHLDWKYIWLLARQPYASTQELPTITIPPLPEPVTSCPVDIAPDPSPPTLSNPYSPWHLWDGRFWLRVSNSTPSSLVIRPLCGKDLKPFRMALARAQRQHFDDLLSGAAPGKVRWTLPVLARTDGTVIAVPTLGTALDEAVVGGKVRWEVRFRKVDLGARREEVAVR